MTSPQTSNKKTRAERREQKRRVTMKVTGKSVFALRRIITKKAKKRRSQSSR